MARAELVFLGGFSGPHQILQCFGCSVGYPHCRQLTGAVTTRQLLSIPPIRLVGLYLNPPERALVLCVDEKSQVQALDRTRPVLPLRPGVPARQTHDYIRNGTRSLFAALDVATGKVIGSCHRRRRHQEFLRFLERIDEAVPEPLDIHLVMDNYGTHQTQSEALVCAMVRR